MVDKLDMVGKLETLGELDMLYGGGASPSPSQYKGGAAPRNWSAPAVQRPWRSEICELANNRAPPPESAGGKGKEKGCTKAEQNGAFFDDLITGGANEAHANDSEAEEDDAEGWTMTDSAAQLDDGSFMTCHYTETQITDGEYAKPTQEMEEAFKRIHARHEELLNKGTPCGRVTKVDEATKLTAKGIDDEFDELAQSFCGDTRDGFGLRNFGPPITKTVKTCCIADPPTKSDGLYTYVEMPD